MLRLTKKEQVLEERLESVCRENTELRASLASVHARLALCDQLEQQQSQQVRLGWPTYAETHSGNTEHISVVWCVCDWKGFNNKGISCSQPSGRGFSGIVESKAKQSPHPRHCNIYSQSWIPLMLVQFRAVSESGIWHVRIVSLWVLEWILFCFDWLVATFEETHVTRSLSCCHISG